ncbi:hypothetical protein ROBYS_16170 [Roseobacter sp. OBYS 0001]|nr:hypothetical protein ROBYS_16170 [Roseobacter sp. OBYS 0001]
MALRFPYPGELALPLRDLMRGAQQISHIPMTMAAPVVSHLPEPLRSTLSEIGLKAEDIYKSSLQMWHPKNTEIQQAARLLAEPSLSDLAVFGRVVSWAMEVALAQDQQDSFFVSETVVTLALKDTLDDVKCETCAATRAAGVFLAVVAQGLGPSTQRLPISRMSPARSVRLRSAAFSAMLFLLAERAKSADEEMKILSYAITITNLIAEDIHAAGKDTAQITSLLRSHAKMI